LIETGDFKPTENKHRCIFKGGETIDIVPFGPIAGKKQSIAWPPTEDTVMRVLGFEEAFRSPIPVTLRREPRLDFSPSCWLAMMKLISWDDHIKEGERQPRPYYITENYVDAGMKDSTRGFRPLKSSLRSVVQAHFSRRIPPGQRDIQQKITNFIMNLRRQALWGLIRHSGTDVFEISLTDLHCSTAYGTDFEAETARRRGEW
jgi:hypothetical protein